VYEKYRDAGVQVLSVAVDAQGPERARPFVEEAKATFPVVVDEENLLSNTYGFKVVPNCLLVDEQGVLRYKNYGGFEIRNAESARLVNEWATSATIGGVEPGTEPQAPGPEHSRAITLFQKGMELYRQARVQEALAQWREAVVLEPDNYVIRKQIWAVENPGKFYQGSVDFDWQKEQLQKGL